MSVDLSDDYRPSDDEEFMNERQLAFFRRLLENWKADILDGAKQTINNLQDESGSLPDIVDRASAESDKALELRTRDRQRKHIETVAQKMSTCVGQISFEEFRLREKVVDTFPVVLLGVVDTGLIHLRRMPGIDCATRADVRIVNHAPLREFVGFPEPLHIKAGQLAKLFGDFRIRPPTSWRQTLVIPIRQKRGAHLSHIRHEPVIGQCQYLIKRTIDVMVFNERMQAGNGKQFGCGVHTVLQL